MIIASIIWLVLSALVASYADTRRGKSFGGFFILSVCLSPLVGLIIALLIKPNIEKLEQRSIAVGDSKKCPSCAELIRADALKCKHCGTDLIHSGTVANPNTACTSEELFQKAYNQYKEATIENALITYKSLIFSFPNSSEAVTAKAQIRKALSSKQFYQIAYSYQNSLNDLGNASGFYRLLSQIYPNSQEVIQANKQIRILEENRKQ